MGHTKPEDLVDLKNELATIRKLPLLKEKSPGVFYFKSIPFLHFHDKDGERWADIKVNGSWERVNVPFQPNKSVRAAFLNKVCRAYDMKSSERRIHKP